MRILFTLIKRQMIDSTAYFAVAGLATMALSFGIATAVFTEDHTNLSPYTRILLVTSPLLVAMGPCALGLIQARADRISGIAAVLSVLPVRRVQVLLAQIVTGVCVVLTALIPPAVTGTLLWKFYGPPDWLFHPWITDSFIGSSLTALACYLLGLHAGQKSATSVSALGSLPLTLILLLLVAIRGFGTPLLAVLIPLILVLFFRCWKPHVNTPLTIISVGLTVLIWLGVPLCLGRYFCNGWLVTTLDASAKISPSGLLPPEIENDPNISKPSEAHAGVTLPLWWTRPDCLVCNLWPQNPFGNRKFFETRHYLLENSGIVQYFLSRERGGRDAYSLHRAPRSPLGIVHLDEAGGQLLYRHAQTDERGDPRTWQWENVAVTYGGPDGVSSDPNTAGRFSSPTVYFGRGSPLRGHWWLDHCVVYDRDSRRFYRIDFERQIVRKGPEVLDSSVGPVDLRMMRLSGEFSATRFYLPSTRSHRTRLPFDAHIGSGHLPIVGESGRIDLLDRNTLTLFGPAGFLPAPRTPFGRASSKPRYLMDYDVDAVWLIPSSSRPGSDNIKMGFVGIVAVSVSRQGMWTSVAVFDDKGDKIKSASSETGLFDKPLNATLTLTKYVLESLHPPVLAVASFFTAYSFEARSTHRALFLMPNSFVAMARDYEGNIFYAFLIVLLLMLPALLFAGLLSWLVTRDATTLGLSRNARRLWVLATLAFGLPAYVTYRLIRPKITLVTCANCGKQRRSDMDKCHRCGSKWDVPELTPPAWRVLDGAE